MNSLFSDMEEFEFYNDLKQWSGICFGGELNLENFSDLWEQSSAVDATIQQSTRWTEKVVTGCYPHLGTRQRELVPYLFCCQSHLTRLLRLFQELTLNIWINLIEIVQSYFPVIWTLKVLKDPKKSYFVVLRRIRLNKWKVFCWSELNLGCLVI